MPRRREVVDSGLQEAQEGLGPAIEVLRIRAGLSRVELAEKTGLGRSTILKLESGERHPSPETLMNVASALESDVDSLLTAAWIAAAPGPDARRKRASDLLKVLTSPNAKKILPAIAGVVLVASSSIAIPTSIAAAAAAGVVARTRAKEKSSARSEKETLLLEVLLELADKSHDELRVILSSLREQSG